MAQFEMVVKERVLMVLLGKCQMKKEAILGPFLVQQQEQEFGQRTVMTSLPISVSEARR
jgi:hypothetical protein